MVIQKPLKTRKGPNAICHHQNQRQRATQQCSWSQLPTVTGGQHPRVFYREAGETAGHTVVPTCTWHHPETRVTGTYHWSRENETRKRMPVGSGAIYAQTVGSSHGIRAS